MFKVCVYVCVRACVCVRVCVCVCVLECVCWLVSMGIIKVIDFLGSIMRAGVATVTFGRKCHSTLNDVSDDRPYFGAFFQYGRHVQSNTGRTADIAEQEERKVGRGGEG